MRAWVLLLLLIPLSGCFGSEVQDPTPVSVPAQAAPVAFTCTPQQPIAGEPVLCEVHTANATDVVWLVAGQRHGGAVIQLDLPVGTHEVRVRYHVAGTWCSHDGTITVAAPASVSPVPDSAAEPESENEEAVSDEPDWEVQLTQDRNQISGRIDGAIAPAAVRWFFGDGVTSGAIDALHQYNQPGAYFLRAVASRGEYSWDSGPIAVQIDDVPLAIVLETNRDTVHVAAQWDQPGTFTWDFGDGLAASGQEVTHHYESPGPHTIKLTASGGDMVEHANRTIRLENYPLIASVEVDHNIATFEANWEFDANWTWHFGDGRSSHDAAPTHRYPAEGNYTVIVVAHAGENSGSARFWVQIDETHLAMEAALNLAQFDASAIWDLEPDGFVWNLDGLELEAEAISHTFTSLGPKAVRLTATSGPYVETVRGEFVVHTLPPVAIVDVPPGNIASFAFDWVAQADSVSWAFGDGGTSNDPAPSYTYDGGKGVYEATVTLTNESLQAVGIDQVQATVEVDILWDGIPQFDCGGEPVFEPTDTYGEQDGILWGAFKNGGRAAVFWKGPIQEIEVLRNNWTAYQDAAGGDFHAFVMDGLTPGESFCFRVGEQLHAIRLTNAYNEYDGGAYLFNAMIYAPPAIDSDMLMEGIAGYANRLHDAGDGHLKPGLTVVIQDWSWFEEPVGTPASSESDPCIEGPDSTRGTFTNSACQIFDVQFAYATDPSTAGFTTRMGIEQPNGIIFLDGSGEAAVDQSNAAAREAQVLEIDAVITHEFGHYALNMGDRYVALPGYPPLVPVYTCNDPMRDLSVMGSGRGPTEFDGTGYECPDTAWSVPIGSGTQGGPSWQEMYARYPQVGDRVGPALDGPIGPGQHFALRHLIAGV